MPEELADDAEVTACTALAMACCPIVYLVQHYVRVFATFQERCVAVFMAMFILNYAWQIAHTDNAWRRLDRMSAPSILILLAT